MKLEFWLDYLSPICYKQHQTIEELFKNNQLDHVELLYRSFELIPEFDLNKQYTFLELLKNTHYDTQEKIDQIVSTNQINMKVVNGHDAHRLSHLAKKYHLAFEYNTKIFSALFEDNQDISNHQVLLDIALEIGLESSKIHEVLSSNMYADAVFFNRENALSKGIIKLPHLRIDGQINLRGYHTKKEVMDQLLITSNKKTKNKCCEEENCERKKVR